jgi:hypothetical protein
MMCTRGKASQEEGGDPDEEDSKMPAAASADDQPEFPVDSQQVNDRLATRRSNRITPHDRTKTLDMIEIQTRKTREIVLVLPHQTAWLPPAPESGYSK